MDDDHFGDPDNLLEETLIALEKHGKKAEDVLFVTDGDNYQSFSEFMDRANFIYDNGYGSADINQNLKIVGRDWWLERYEYDGSEWWEYKRLPDRPKNHANVILRLKNYED